MDLTNFISMFTFVMSENILHSSQYENTHIVYFYKHVSTTLIFNISITVHMEKHLSFNSPPPAHFQIIPAALLSNPIFSKLDVNLKSKIMFVFYFRAPKDKQISCKNVLFDKGTSQK